MAVTTRKTDDADAVARIAVERCWPTYRRAVAQLLDGERPDWEDFRRELAKAWALAHIIGRASVIDRLREAAALGEVEWVEVKEQPPIEPPPIAYELPDKLLSLPLVDAANEFLNSVPGLTESFPRILRFANDTAWFITGVEDAQVLQTLGKVIADMLHDKSVGAANINQGKWFLESEKALDFARWRLNTIFNTTVSRAVGAGAWIQDSDPFVRKISPFWQYTAFDDARTRPHHAAFHGFVAPAGDPVWQQIDPPNGYNCRCDRFSRSTLNARDAGWINSRDEITGKHRDTWTRAIAAGLITADGALTTRKVRLNGRTDRFPQEGFDTNGGDGTMHLSVGAGEIE